MWRAVTPNGAVQERLLVRYVKHDLNLCLAKPPGAKLKETVQRDKHVCPRERARTPLRLTDSGVGGRTQNVNRWNAQE